MLYAFAMMVGIAILVRWQRVGIEKEIVTGALRSFLQLIAIGAVLLYIFDAGKWYVSVGVLGLMYIFAILIVIRRERHSKLRRLWLLTAISIAVGLGCTSGPIWVLVLQVEPWWHPRYFILINSMCLSFCMNGVALTVERFQADLKIRKDQVELALSLGALPREAIHSVYRTAVAGPMIPAMNMMAAVGLVQLPGFMTGQITGGADPMEAVKYQILIIFMMVISRTLTVMTFAHLSYQQYFTSRMQLRHDMIT